MSPVIEITGLTKTYRLGEVEVHALRGIDLTIEHGEFVAIMGASGSGKTTLMNIVGCLDRPDTGTYLLEGVDVAVLDEEKLAAIRSRRIGFVFQNFNLLSRTSAIENIELPLFYSGWSQDSEKRAAELIEMLGLSGRAQSHPNQLSGGQQQRVAIARALINRPAILLADEPTGNLDSQTSVELLETIRLLNREQGLTVIVVTHDPDVASYADRTVTFRDGVIVSDDHRRASAPRGPAAIGAGAPASAPAAGDDAWTFAMMALSAAARAIGRNKMRAALTMLGIFIGVAAVIAMVAVGDGARLSIEQQIASLGTNLIIVLPGATTANGVHAGFGTNSTLTVDDARAIRKQAQAVSKVSYFDRQVAQVVYGNQNWSTQINGTTANYIEVRNWPVAYGRSFTNAEQQRAAAVCVLGQTVVENLFGADQNPLGAIVRIKSFPLRVIGVLTVKGQSTFGQDQDDVVLIPFATAERKVLGVAAATPAATPTTTTATPANPSTLYSSVGVSVYGADSVLVSPFGAPPKISGVVNMIFTQAASADQLGVAQSEIEAVLRRQHHIPPGQVDDFTVRNLSDVAQASESATRVMTLLLAAVASISLLVGGIGIMNIMLVSVTERTREIGIRMAIGARRLHILLQFLVEAIMLSTLGGIAGAVLGIAVSKLISMLAGWPTQLSPVAVGGGFLFSAAVGVFFGYYPARKASMLRPIEALRYE